MKGSWLHFKQSNPWGLGQGRHFLRKKIALEANGKGSWAMQSAGSQAQSLGFILWGETTTKYTVFRCRKTAAQRTVCCFCWKNNQVGGVFCNVWMMYKIYSNLLGIFWSFILCLWSGKFLRPKWAAQENWNAQEKWGAQDKWGGQENKWNANANNWNAQAGSQHLCVVHLLWNLNPKVVKSRWGF